MKLTARWLLEMAADCKSKNRHCWRSMGFFFSTGGRGEKLIYLGFRLGLGEKKGSGKKGKDRWNRKASSEH